MPATTQTFHGNARGCLICGGTVNPTMREHDMQFRHESGGKGSTHLTLHQHDMAKARGARLQVNRIHIAVTLHVLGSCHFSARTGTGESVSPTQVLYR